LRRCVKRRASMSNTSSKLIGRRRWLIRLRQLRGRNVDADLHTSLNRAQCTKVSGSVVSETGVASRHGLMALFMKETGSLVTPQGTESSSMWMVTYTMGTGSTTEPMAMASTSTRTGHAMMANGRTTFNTETERRSGPMARCI
jgi:hypothetical protein